MEILALIAASVTHFHGPPTTAAPTGERDDAACNRRNRRTRRRCVIDAVMSARVIQDRMTTSAGKCGRDPRLEFQRRLQKKALQRSALRIVVTRLAVWRRKA